MRFGNKKRNGFTLVEVIISMTLIVLVGSIVISIITFTNSYSKKNDAISTRTRELTALRMDIDKWFSYMDISGNSEKISTTTSGYIVYCDVNEYISVSEDGYSYTFYYADNNENNTTATFENIYTLKFAKEGNLNDESEPVERFTINLPVLNTYYICGVYYG